MEQIIKGKYLLQRRRKYTNLFLNGSILFTWQNEDIDFRLGDFDKQVEWFKNHLRG